MDARFDIYLSGKLADGVTPAAAAAALAQLFRSAPETMAAMIDGKPRLLKRDVDHPTALKYRDALQRAGVMVAFRPFTRPTTAPAPAAAAPKPASIASGESAERTTNTDSAQGAGALSLAPVGELLRPDERPVTAAVAVDISHLRVEPPGELPRAEPIAPPMVPDTSQLSVAEVGGQLAPPRPEVAAVELSAEMAAMTLAPAGATLETLSTELPPLDPDTSALSLAEPGELLRPDERRRTPPPPPSTDHIRLA